MNLHTLKKFASYINYNSKLRLIKRIGDNLFYVNINGEIFYFDLSRGKSLIFITQESLISSKSYNAPFDKTLLKLSNSTIIKAIAEPNNRILKLYLQIQNSYKSQEILMQVEFTGKNTNLIILQDNIVQDALHHISNETSFREVKINKPLAELSPLKEFKDKDEGELFYALKNNFEKLQQNLLSAKKLKLKNKISQKISQINKNLSSLKNKDDLEKNAKKHALYGHKILEHLHNFSNFKGSYIVLDGLKITLPNNCNNLSLAAQIFFKTSKKENKKAQNLHIESENLLSKKEFYKNLLELIENTHNIGNLDIIDSNLSYKHKSKKETKTNESFFIEGFKISIGKNSKENIELLENAKADDLWMHIKNIPSSHLIIHSGKNKIPEIIIKKAAELLVSYYKGYSGRYEVDYTKRKFVKIVQGANVNYGKENTIVILKD